MMAGRTFGKKLGVGFGLILGLTLVIAVTSVAALAFVANSNNRVIAVATDNLVGAQQLETTMESRISDYRAYLLNGQQKYLDMTRADRSRFLEQVVGLRQLLSDQRARALLEQVSAAEAAHAALVSPVIERRKSIRRLADIAQLQATDVGPARQTLQNSTAALVKRVGDIVSSDRAHASSRATIAMVAIITLGVAALLAGIWMSFRLSRDLKREIGTAVGHIQSSSAQLEAAAAQQATGGRDQSSAMSEITTTISELLITSRQIAESAQRVSKIAEETAEAARTGDATIDQTRTSITAIRTQVDQIVQHMLALGEKSQQIGGVVDLVSELAEQTNILAINATIEASGAGEWGRRFAVVAEEIRKLADRTAGSTKEIRALIDDVRGAVNTTVMATEIGAKAVDAGSRQFDDATNSFRRIAQLVATTSDATREIELSTKQQTSAVEQVNVAASDTARVTRETEASAVQTKQTAAHLSTLSGDLLDLVGSGRH
jgi:methyl-accepting chemotaxis protein